MAVNQDLPLVSVSMPVYNGLPFLDTTIESILAQTLTDFEFIIVDDASTDGSWERLTDWARRDRRIHVHRNTKNSGHRATSNRGFALARGRYVARTDQDDLSLPTRLEAQVEMMQRNPALGLTGTGYRRQYPDGRSTEHRPPTRHAELRWGLLFNLMFPHSSFMFRREVLGGADAYRYAPAAYDYEVCARLAQRVRVGAIADPLVVYRCHPAGMSVRQKKRMEISEAAISARQIKSLLAPQIVCRAEIEGLRRWSRPGAVLEKDLALGALFLELLEVFCRQSDIGEAAASSIRAKWIASVVRGLRPTVLASLPGSQFMSALLRADPLGVARALLTQLPSRVRGDVGRLRARLTR